MKLFLTINIIRREWRNIFPSRHIKSKANCLVYTLILLGNKFKFVYLLKLENELYTSIIRAVINNNKLNIGI
ncbi:hypothetical protein O166_21635 [Pseudogulbenkiania ferrooxidans EGD-HP2]|uniref:Uncharacterized protein n=1 Tax=Pseudogulbenkiania ferrooxidans EGD-HP2 TaxID=1388764 RepID=A0ABN0NAU4_9NEIS|nr:hypothetical protein O166_21635 [Pseudogulbenkiania ferrooxidans EGD-HP2]